MMEVTLSVHGRKMTFSEKDLITILENYFPNESIEQITTEKTMQFPTENQLFEVNPPNIDQSIFQEERSDEKQEKMRRLILEAFIKLDSNPKRYAKKFKTLIPKRTWVSKTIKELEELPSEMGGHSANWVEQALEWAQCISNGESWNALCNNSDTAKWCRLIIWKDGSMRIVGGSTVSVRKFSASDIREIECYYDCDSAVPLVVFYDE